MVTVAKGNFKFPFIFWLFLSWNGRNWKKEMVPVRGPLSLINKTIPYPLNLVGNSVTTGVLF